MSTKIKSKTHWRSKLEKPQEAKIVKLEGKAAEKWGGGTMVIPKPLDVDRLVKKIPEGKVLLLDELRQELAREYKTNIACPLTTGIFLRIAAETAEEDVRNGVSHVTPYWRVLKSDGSLNMKFPGSIEAQAEKLREEGFRLVANKTGTQMKVADYSHYLYHFD